MTNRDLKRFKNTFVISNIINAIYLAFATLFTVLSVIAIVLMQVEMASLMENVQSADGESFLGGYQAIGSLFGIGSLSVVTVVLYCILIVLFFCLAILLIPTINGFRLQAKLNRSDSLSETLRKIKFNLVFKCITAVLFLAPCIYASFENKTFSFSLLSLPQLAVLLLSAYGLYRLPNKRELIEADMWAAEELQSETRSTHPFE